MNRDGFLDIIAGESRLAPGTDLVEVFLQDALSPGKFRSAIINAVGPVHAFHIASGDLNGDGWPEVVADDIDGISLLIQDAARPGVLLPPQLRR